MILYLKTQATSLHFIKYVINRAGCFIVGIFTCILLLSFELSGGKWVFPPKLPCSRILLDLSLGPFFLYLTVQLVRTTLNSTQHCKHARGGRV